MSRQSIQSDVFSEKHIKGEDKFKKFIEDCWGCKLEKLPIDYRLDYAVVVAGAIVIVQFWLRVPVNLMTRNIPACVLSAPSVGEAALTVKVAVEASERATAAYAVILSRISKL